MGVDFCRRYGICQRFLQMSIGVDFNFWQLSAGGTGWRRTRTLSSVRELKCQLGLTLPQMSTGVDFTGVDFWGLTNFGHLLAGGTGWRRTRTPSSVRSSRAARRPGSSSLVLRTPMPSQGCSWSHLVVLAAILWTFLAKSCEKLSGGQKARVVFAGHSRLPLDERATSTGLHAAPSQDHHRGLGDGVFLTAR